MEPATQTKSDRQPPPGYWDVATGDDDEFAALIAAIIGPGQQVASTITPRAYGWLAAYEDE